MREKEQEAGISCRIFQYVQWTSIITYIMTRVKVEMGGNKDLIESNLVQSNPISHLLL